MDYVAQQRYFSKSRIWGMTAATAVIGTGALCLFRDWPWSNLPSWLGLSLVVSAIGISVFYSPDYLHLTVRPEKRIRWNRKVRWRIAVLVPVLTAALTGNIYVAVVAAVAGAWIAVSNVFCRTIPARFAPASYLACDFVLFAVLGALGKMDVLILFAVVAVATHLFIAISKPQIVTRDLLVLLLGLIFVFVATVWLYMQLAPPFRAGMPSLNDVAWSGFALISAAAGTSMLLCQRSQRQRAFNVAEALAELQSFTGNTPNRVIELWSTADKQLARNWEASGAANKSPEEIAEWYRQNSELYMFAISAYNLEYKRIKSNLRMLRFASGAVLDYGAGNGELILECARRGHRAAYYDVDGVSKRFAQFRAAKYGLQVEFALTKEELRRIAEAAPFDTIFSFDVLEHIPDLAGELDFLISLLSPNGLLIFDVPAGATVSHPMHLNHTLNVKQHLIAQGLKEVPMRSWRIGKQEKYAFRKTAMIAEQSPVKALQ